MNIAPGDKAALLLQMGLSEEMINALEQLQVVNVDELPDLSFLQELALAPVEDVVHFKLTLGEPILAGE